MAKCRLVTLLAVCALSVGTATSAFALDLPSIPDPDYVEPVNAGILPVLRGSSGALQDVLTGSSLDRNIDIALSGLGATIRAQFAYVRDEPVAGETGGISDAWFDTGAPEQDPWERRVSADAIRDRLLTRQLNHAISFGLARIERCYDRLLLTATPRREGTVVLVLTVGAGGGAEQVVIQRDTLAQPRLSRCLVSAARQIQMARAPGERIIVEIPLQFRSGDVQADSAVAPTDEPAVVPETLMPVPAPGNPPIHKQRVGTSTAGIDAAEQETRGVAVDESAGGLDSVFTIEQIDRRGRVVGTGTGFYISTDGRAMTAGHIVRRDHKLRIRTADGRFLQVHSYESVDHQRDVAVFRVELDRERVVPLPLADGRAPPTLDLTVVGALDGRTLADGQVQLGRLHAVLPDRMILDGFIAPGASGSPIVDADGYVVAIATGALQTPSGLIFTAAPAIRPRAPEVRPPPY